MQLLQMGASVTRVSPPTERDIGIALNADADVLNRGKTPLALNLKERSDQDKLHELLSNADVLIEGFRPGVLERLGLEPTGLQQQFAQLVIGRLSGFGRYGDYAQRAGHDINYLALSGVLAAIGTADEPIIPLNLFTSSQQYNSESWPAMSDAFSLAFAKRTRDEWAVDALSTDCCLTPVLDFAESMVHPHTIANGWVINNPFPHPGLVTHFGTQTS